MTNGNCTDRCGKTLNSAVMVAVVKYSLYCLTGYGGAGGASEHGARQGLGLSPSRRRVSLSITEDTHTLSLSLFDIYIYIYIYIDRSTDR